MGITEAKDEISPEMERIIRELKRLEEMSIHIGIQGLPGRDESGMEREGAPADILTIANVNEFGATIKAKNVKNLAIPIAKSNREKPTDFPGLFFLRSRNGYLFGCISKKRKGTSQKKKSSPTDSKPKRHGPSKKQIPKKTDDIEFLFILMESTSIPERSFIRAGYDNNRRTIEDITTAAIQNIIFSGWDAEKAANNIGMGVVGIIQMYMNQPFNFKKRAALQKRYLTGRIIPLSKQGVSVIQLLTA